MEQFTYDGQALDSGPRVPGLAGSDKNEQKRMGPRSIQISEPLKPRWRPQWKAEALFNCKNYSPLPDVKSFFLCVQMMLRLLDSKKEMFCSLSINLVSGGGQRPRMAEEEASIVMIII